MMMYLIERSEYYDDDVVADRKVKVLKMLLKMLLIEKGQSAEDVADRKVKVLKMLLIQRSKC